MVGGVCILRLCSTSCLHSSAALLLATLAVCSSPSAFESCVSTLPLAVSIVWLFYVYVSVMPFYSEMVKYLLTTDYKKNEKTKP